ncbi:MAG: hypothetical protein FJ104_15975 [Deltaproteobacteria bacterium]|nr:hypothetical protein [Deltaproteobacteria bacterium]
MGNHGLGHAVSALAWLLAALGTACGSRGDVDGSQGGATSDAAGDGGAADLRFIDEGCEIGPGSCVPTRPDVACCSRYGAYLKRARGCGTQERMCARVAPEEMSAVCGGYEADLCFISADGQHVFFFGNNFLALPEDLRYVRPCTSAERRDAELARACGEDGTPDAGR